MSQTNVIEVEQVSFSYGGPISALDQVSLSIKQGDFACLIGPNGGGKTTLLRLMLGLLRPNKGRVRLLGNPPRKSRHRIGYMPQRDRLDLQFPIRVRDVVLTGRLNPIGPYGEINKGIADQAIQTVGLHELRFHPFSALSGGQRRRVLIARALACEPDILMLDEPTSNLDLAFQNDLYELLHDLNKHMTIVMVSHDVAFVSKHVNTIVCVNRHVEAHAAADIAGDFIKEMYGIGRGMRLIMHEHSHP